MPVDLQKLSEIGHRRSQFTIVRGAPDRIRKKLVRLNDLRRTFGYGGAGRAFVRVNALHQTLVRGPNHFGAGFGTYFQNLVVVHRAAHPVPGIERPRPPSLNSGDLTNTACTRLLRQGTLPFFIEASQTQILCLLLASRIFFNLALFPGGRFGLLDPGGFLGPD